MNIITDTIDEIRKMRVRKVFCEISNTYVVLAPRLEFRHDHMLSSHDMEDVDDCYKYRKPCRGGT
jgi:hypothetical protein